LIELILEFINFSKKESEKVSISMQTVD